MTVTTREKKDDDPLRPLVVFASRNRGKLRELTALLADVDVAVLPMDAFPDIPDVSEDGDSFFENALKKASTVARATGHMAIADDSGLEVAVLDGRPGIRSARYAGDDATDDENIRALLAELADVPPEQRGAAFRCVLVLFRPDGTFDSFEGMWEGSITLEPKGEGGFGYDPIFHVPGYGVTAAELPPETKNRISHRAQAFSLLKKALKESVR